MIIRSWEHSEKGVTDGQTDRKYHSLSCLVAAKTLWQKNNLPRRPCGTGFTLVSFYFICPLMINLTDLCTLNPCKRVLYIYMYLDDITHDWLGRPKQKDRAHWFWKINHVILFMLWEFRCCEFTITCGHNGISIIIGKYFSDHDDYSLCSLLVPYAQESISLSHNPAGKGNNGNSLSSPISNILGWLCIHPRETYTKCVTTRSIVLVQKLIVWK